MRWGKPPSSFILGSDQKSWNKWDILVAEAYEIVQREKCGQCGLPVWVCRSDDEHIQFKMKRDTCHAIAKKSEYEKKHQKDAENHAITIRPEPHVTDGRDLIQFREPYYKSLYERNQDPESALI